MGWLLSSMPGTPFVYSRTWTIALPRVGRDGDVLEHAGSGRDALRTSIGPSAVRQAQPVASCPRSASPASSTA